jgi:nitrite reductase (NADH) small subunit
MVATLESEAASPDANPRSWLVICALEDVIPGTGVAALVEGKQVAVFRTRDGESVYVLSNFDPFSRAFVLSRGILGCRGGIPKVASPIYKQTFDLRTGRCLEDHQVCLPVYAARVRDGRIEVQAGSSSR